MENIETDLHHDGTRSATIGAPLPSGTGLGAMPKTVN